MGLHYLKRLYDVSDEPVVAGLVENPHWQYFCREEFFVHELPCNPTSLVKWRRGPGQTGWSNYWRKRWRRRNGSRHEAE